jgi:hypothetical protein
MARFTIKLGVVSRTKTTVVLCPLFGPVSMVVGVDKWERDIGGIMNVGGNQKYFEKTSPYRATLCHSSHTLWPGAAHAEPRFGTVWFVVSVSMCSVTSKSSQKIKKPRDIPYMSKHIFHLVVCLTTGPKPLPKRALHIVRTRVSSFKWKYPLLSLRSSNSFLCLLSCLSVTLSALVSFLQ